MEDGMTAELQKELQKYQDAIIAKVASKVVAGRWALEKENKDLLEENEKLKKHKECVYLQLYGGSKTHDPPATVKLGPDPTTFYSDIYGTHKQKPVQIYWVVGHNIYTGKFESKRLVNPTPSELAIHDKTFDWRYVAEHWADEMNAKAADEMDKNEPFVWECSGCGAVTAFPFSSSIQRGDK